MSALPPQLTLLYEEVLYTILHRLGKPEHHHVADAQELYAYVQKVGSQRPDGALTRPSSQPKGMGLGAWREFLTSILKAGAAAGLDASRLGSICLWERYLGLGVVGRTRLHKGFRRVSSPSAGLCAPLLSPAL